MKDRWEFYKDAKNEWRWRRIAGNNRIVGASSEGYKNRLDCVANASRNGYAEAAAAESDSITEDA